MPTLTVGKPGKKPSFAATKSTNRPKRTARKKKSTKRWKPPKTKQSIGSESAADHSESENRAIAAESTPQEAIIEEDVILLPGETRAPRNPSAPREEFVRRDSAHASEAIRVRVFNGRNEAAEADGIATGDAVEIAADAPTVAAAVTVVDADDSSPAEVAAVAARQAMADINGASERVARTRTCSVASPATDFRNAEGRSGSGHPDRQGTTGQEGRAHYQSRGAARTLPGVHADDRSHRSLAKDCQRG